jgi:hypothetical protein
VTVPNPSLMIEYCRDVLPGMLRDGCGVDVALANAIGADVLARAEALASLSGSAQDVLTAPFVEEVFDHRPVDAGVSLLADVTVVVRNSMLEHAHNSGPLREGIVTITEYAAGPLSHFLAARRRAPMDTDTSANPFAGLAETYARAWAALSALVAVLDEGGREPLSLPPAATPVVHWRCGGHRRDHGIGWILDGVRCG